MYLNSNNNNIHQSQFIEKIAILRVTKNDLGETFLAASQGKRFPPQDPYFLKMVKSTGLLIFQVLLGPVNPILKKWSVTLILGAETGFEIACITYITY